MSKLAVFFISLIGVCPSVMPAQAFPSLDPVTIQTPAVDLIQYRRYHGNYGRHYGGSWGGYRNYGRSYYGGYRPYGGYHYGGGYYGRGYYGGYYGGYNDFGLVLGGLATGAIIGGALAQPRYYYDQPAYYEQPRYYGNSHSSWCYSRYRSYRAYDNSFQPYYGPRRQCVGPY
jgi:hypothetical protein